MLNKLANEIHRTAVEKGFWYHLDGNASIWPEKIALIHSEASEMLDALRSSDEEALAEECADLLIRLLDFTDARCIDIDFAVEKKMLKNKGRPHLHGRAF